MHSRLYCIRIEGESSEEDINNTISDVINDERVYDTNGIDYFSEMEGSSFNEQLKYYKERLKKDFDSQIVFSNGNKITITKEALTKYWKERMDEIVKFVNSRTAEEFVKDEYLFKCIFNDEHPKYLSAYCGYLENEHETFMTLFNYMRYNKLDSVTYEVVRIFDYHF